MGRVFLARDLKKNRLVALKTMLAKKSVVTETEVRRFQREMATCAKLKHPNIVAFYDMGYHKGVFYFAMEYCRDGSVQDMLEKAGGSITILETVAVARQVLDGLGYAHEQGIVHRDLKPSNILLVLDGSRMTAMIADFGLSKNFQQAGLSGMTMTGTFSGTMAFMPPEQIINFRDVKPVSDVFAVGATMYTMLTGRCVYDFESAGEPIRAILEKKIIPIRRRGVKLPEKLMDVVDRATKPEPEDRFQSVLDMKAALKKAM